MIGIVWVVLIVFIAIYQLSQAHSTTTLKGRPFEQPRGTVKLPTSRPAPPRPSGISFEPMPEFEKQEIEPRGQVAESLSVGRPNLHAAVIWSEILDKPISKRKSRRP